MVSAPGPPHGAWFPRGFGIRGLADRGVPTDSSIVQAVVLEKSPMVSLEQGNSSAQRSHPRFGVTPVTPYQGLAISAACHSSGSAGRLAG